MAPLNTNDTILGLDPSTQTGWCVISMDGTKLHWGTLHYPPEANRFVRWTRYYNHFLSLVQEYEPKICMIEGYGYANKFTLATMVEIGALFRMASHSCGLPFIEVTPMSLKKFITGSGAAKKEVMMLELFKRWAVTFDDNNQADAYALAQVGRALHGADLGLPKANLTALDVIKKKL